ncbi:MAG TPA: hypothetical protein VES19_05965, partial [Candidatus Limnocylindrales bacterium]|nr:hypothetical protein [Candidatus Limnocylindrales bacterium]
MLVRLGGVFAAGAVMLGGPVVALAHGLSPTYQSPLPLAIYLAGAAATVALSFVFVLARDLRAGPTVPGRVTPVPAVVRHGLRAIGLLGWAWMMAQGIAGGSSPGAVADLFLWVYGWVGIAILSALVFPIWEWLDPFATLHDLGAGLLRRLGVTGWAPSGLPRGARVWPAAAGFAFFVWLELAATPDNAALTLILAGYTVFTLALMAQYGRNAWRAGGETFTVWFRTLNRLAAIGVAPASATGVAPTAGVDPDAVDGRAVLRRPFASGLLEGTWETPRIVLVAIGTGSIIFDGLSQTVAFASVFGAPALPLNTLLLVAFLGIIAGAALVVARTVSPGAIGAGLLPIATGYLVAHYLTYLLIDGQRILIALSDPLQQGSDLFGTAFFEPTAGWLPPGLVWTAQLAAVVGGHMLGAWAGHVAAQRDMDAAAYANGNGNGNGRAGRDLRHRKIHDPDPLPGPRRNVRMREIPLAIVMVALTTL